MTSSARSQALVCALAAVIVAGAAALATVSAYGHHVSALVHLSDTDALAADARSDDRDFAFVPSGAHYDGVYFYAIARDPLARGPEHELLDRGAYRYGHPGYGWLGRIVSFGRGAEVPWALLLIALEAIAIAGFAASLLAREHGLSGWWGLIVALSPGIVYSVTVLTSETVAAAALLGTLLLWRRGHWPAAAAVAALGCFVKEPLVLVPIAIVLWELIERWRTGKEARESLPALAKRAGPLAIGPLLYAQWYGYVWARFDAYPAGQASDLTDLPFVGWFRTLERAASLGASPDFSSGQIGAVTIPLVVVAAAALLLGGVRAVRARTELDVVFLLLTLLCFTLNWWNLLYPKDLVRALALPLLLLPFVLAQPRRAREAR